MSSAANADRNLLFGMFALQNDHITQDQLIAAFQAWILRKDRPLDAIILEHEWMNGEEIASLNALLDRRVAKAGGQRQLLEALPDDRCVLNTLSHAIRDDDVLRSAASVQAFFTRSIRPGALVETETGSSFRPSDPDSRTEIADAAVRPDPTPFDSESQRTALPVDSDSTRTDTGTGTVRVAGTQHTDPTFADDGAGMRETDSRSAAAGPAVPRETRIRFETEFVFTEPGHLLGSGSFGDVFRSEDREFQRQVAVKRLQEKYLSQGLTPVSFLLEAEINGKLDHPGVLPMYGLGKTPAGVPFYVMKMIEAPDFGQVIDEFHAAEARPDRDPGESNQQFRKLIDHLRSVCMTMQYAHDRGVLHCDLKPANVMTGSYGETYVVDWGMALLVNPVVDWDKTRDHTPANHPLGAIHPDRRAALHGSQGGSRGFIGGTVAYMAPEHRRAHENPASVGLKAMSPSCDVFALGAILYKILTGKLPCQAVEGEDKVRQAERARSADYVSPREVRPGVRKALSAICMKALAPESKNRYRSTAALADDLEKWMADEPVTAYRENLAERSRRWARRNRSAVSAIAASLLFLAFGSVFFGLLQSQHNRELTTERNRAVESEQRAIRNERTAIEQRQLAETNAERAEAREKLAIEAVKQYSDAVTKNEQLKNRPELEELRKELLKSPIEFFRKLRDELQSSKDTRPGSLESLAVGLYQLAVLTDEIGDKADAKATFAQAVEIFDSLVQAKPLMTGYRDSLATAINNLGKLEADNGNTDAARVAYERSIELYEALVKGNPTATGFRDGLANTLNSLGKLEADTGGTDAARVAYERSIELYEALVKGNPTATEFRKGLAMALNNLGILEAVNGGTDAARVACKRSIEMYEALVKGNPTVSEFRYALAITLNSLGKLEADTGNTDAARAAYRRSIELSEALAKGNPTVTGFREGLAMSLDNLGNLEADTGNTDAARAAYRRSIELSEALAKGNPTVTGFREGLAVTLLGLGKLEADTGNTDAARVAYERSIEMYEALVKGNPTVSEFRYGLAMALNNLGILEAVNGDTDAARVAYERSIEMYEALVKGNPTATKFREGLAMGLTNLGILEADSGRPDAARVAYERSNEMYEALVKGNPTVTGFREGLAMALNNLGNLEADTGNTDAAHAAYRHSIELREALVKGNPTATEFRKGLAMALNNLGILEAVNGGTDAARVAYERSIEMYEALVKGNPTVTGFREGLAMALNSLGILEAVNGDTDAARVAYERSIEIREALVKGNPTVTGFREGLANTLTRLGNHGYASGNTDAARAAYRRSIELYEALVQADPTATEYQIGLAQSRDSLGRLEESNAKVTKMLEELRTKAFEEFDKANPKVTEFREGPGISLNSKSWLLVAVPGREPGEYARAVALAEEALKPDPEDGGVLNTLGVAQYRAGQLAAASASLAKSAEMNRKIAKGIENPADLAFLAMAQWKLGQQPDAETTYARLTETMKRPEFAKDREARQFFREATNLIRPLPLPEDVFQH